MLERNELNQKKKYSFKWHYIQTEQSLTPEQQLILEKILSFFPRSADRVLPPEFLSFNTGDYDQNLLSLAANAFDKQGDPVLNIASWHGHPPAIQKLIDLGADPDVFDSLNKLPIHWALLNMYSNPENIIQTVRCLLNAGAQNIDSPTFGTPLQFALKHKNKEAAFLIQTHKQRTDAFKTGATRALLDGFFNSDITNQISVFNDSLSVANLALTCTHMLKEGKKEVKKFTDKFTP